MHPDCKALSPSLFKWLITEYFISKGMIFYANEYLSLLDQDDVTSYEDFFSLPITSNRLLVHVFLNEKFYSLL
jgi:hypothetical protein